ncbi:MAG: hypothetical protein FJ317_07980 [SAR202 cluster bacterium]|nr:hypothetical protein [SAR202 cluster bacterium]
MEILAVALGIALAAALLLAWLFHSMWMKAQAGLRAARFGSRSMSTRYGQMTEQFMPFLNDYPWDPERFRFIGSPIDGIQFEDDRVIIVEFKTGGSTLSATQRRIRDQVRAGKVEFVELRLGAK